MVFERRAFRSEAGVDLIGQTYVTLARSFDPAENSGSQGDRVHPTSVGGRAQLLGHAKSCRRNPKPTLANRVSFDGIAKRPMEVRIARTTRRTVLQTAR
jgi:hypothetical protein